LIACFLERQQGVVGQVVGKGFAERAEGGLHDVLPGR
jgi:hypothetical protein